MEFLVSRWSVEGHTFIVAWEEFVPTMEDVAVLTIRRDPWRNDTGKWST